MKVPRVNKAFYTIRNFLILNVAVLIPFVGLVLWHHPDQLFLFIESDHPLSVGIGVAVDDGDGGTSAVVSRSVGCAVNVRGRPSAQAFMARPNDAEHLCYSFTGAEGSFSIRHAILFSHLFVRRDMTGVDFCRDYYGKDGVIIEADSYGCCVLTKGKQTGVILPKSEANWSFPRLAFDLLTPNMAMCLVWLEFSAILLAFFATFMKRRFSVLSNLVVSAMLAVICGCVVFLVLPLQTFLANQSAFQLSASSVVFSGALDAAILALVLFVILFGSSFACDRVVMVFVVGILVFEYLQTGILSLGYPSLDGDVLFYRNGTWLMMRDYVLLGVFMLGSIVAYRFVSRHVHWIALAVFVMFTVSLFDVRSAEGEVGTGLVTSWTNSVEEVFSSARFSPKRNIILLVPDTVQGDVAVDVVKNNPEVAKQFDGFTAFVNNIGMHEYTATGLPGLLTGRYYDGTHPLEAHFKRATETGSLVADFDQFGWPCFVYAHFGLGMFTNRPKQLTKKEVTAPKPQDALLVRQNGTPFLNLFDIITFRLAPFGMKERVGGKNAIGLGTSHDLFMESALYPIVQDEPIDDAIGATLHVYHSNGVHTPIMYDRFGNQASCAQTYEAMREQVYFVMNSIGRLCSALRERGLFDQSMIVIAADHGSGVSTGKVMDGDEVPGRLIPILWVKPFGANGDIAYDKTPTSHSKVRDMIELAAVHDLTTAEVAQALREEIRLWRRFRGDKIEEFVVDQNGNVSVRTLYR